MRWWKSLIYRAHRAVIFAIAQLSYSLMCSVKDNHSLISGNLEGLLTSVTDAQESFTLNLYKSTCTSCLNVCHAFLRVQVFLDQALISYWCSSCSSSSWVTSSKKAQDSVVSDLQDEIWHDFSSGKCASIDGVGFLVGIYLLKEKSTNVLGLWIRICSAHS